MNRNLLSIAGFDPSAGSGVAADLKTFMAFRCYGVAAITSVTAQNSLGISAIHMIPLEVVGAQIEAICSDMQVHATKIGMLGDAREVEIVGSLLDNFRLPNVVVDPVMRSTSGHALIDEEGIAALVRVLLPKAEVVTPNLHEASVLSGVEVNDIRTMKEAAERIHALGVRNVIVKGGHLPGARAMDLLYDGKAHHVVDAAKVTSRNTRGTGCTFSSVIAVHIAKGEPLLKAIDTAKKYIAKAMAHPFQIGQGAGPLNHSVPV